MSIKIIVLFFMLPLTHVCAQDVSFQTFLSEFEKVNVLIVCLLVNLLTSLTMRNGTPSFCLWQMKNVVARKKIYDGKRGVILNAKTLLLTPCNGTVRTIKMGTVCGSWRMMERTMCS